MTEPRRWLEDSPSPLTRKLLESAAMDRAAAGTKDRVRSLLTLGVVTGSASILAAGQAAAATGATAAAGSGAVGAWSAKTASIALLSAKWLGVAVTVAAASGGAWYFARSQSVSPPWVPATSSVPRTAAAPPLATPQPVASPPAPASLAQPAAAVPRSRPAVSGSSLADEVAAMDAARRGAARGDLAGLDGYLARYPRGSFREPALALRVKLLARQGRTAEARAAARNYLSQYPSGAQAPALRKLLDP